MIYAETPVGNLAGSWIADPAPDSAAAAEAGRKIGVVIQAIDRLPGSCREIVRLVVLEGLSTAEVAAVLGIAQSTVCLQMAKGIKKCAETLAD